MSDGDPGNLRFKQFKGLPFTTLHPNKDAVTERIIENNFLFTFITTVLKKTIRDIIIRLKKNIQSTSCPTRPGGHTGRGS